MLATICCLTLMLFAFLKNQYFGHSFPNLVFYFQKYVIINVSNLEVFSESTEENQLFKVRLFSLTPKGQMVVFEFWLGSHFLDLQPIFFLF